VKTQRTFLRFLVLSALAGALLLVPTPRARATGGAAISNGVIMLGVNNEGQLNIPGTVPSSGGERGVGLRFVPRNFESLTPGCDCEGWGVADLNSKTSGQANEDQGGPQNITNVTFTSTPTTAISKVQVGSVYEVTHDYHPSPQTANLYECSVSIKNIGASPAHVVYRRNMDWDVEPTTFNELVTLQRGSSGIIPPPPNDHAQALVYSSDNGFASSDPLVPGDAVNDSTINANIVHDGPDDHGALFDFDFGTLAPGSTVSFRIFYGAAATEDGALAALAAVGAEVYSLGQPDPGRTDLPIGAPVTFIFAFTGVGGGSIGNTGPIQNLTAQDIDPSNTRITWTTSTPSTSEVDFGPTTSYGRTISDGTLTKQHSILLRNLTPRGVPTRYLHFRVRSVFPNTNPSPESLRGLGDTTGPITVESEDRILTTGRRILGLTPGIAPFVQTIARPQSGGEPVPPVEILTIQGSLSNACPVLATDIVITDVFIEVAGRKYRPTNLTFPQPVGVLRGNERRNFLYTFDAELAEILDESGPGRLVIEGTKKQGKGRQFRDSITIPRDF
jgi:hypothetical protein